MSSPKFRQEMNRKLAFLLLVDTGAIKNVSNNSLSNCFCFCFELYDANFFKT